MKGGEMGRTALAVALVLTAGPAVARAEEPASKAWAAALYVDAYAVPGEDGVLIPTVFLDREQLHLEARYNYEDLRTASFHAGWSFTFGEEEKFLEATPMLGGVVGNVDGMAPGLELEARWGRIGYWLEAEYLIDFGDSSASYLYTWSELTFSALPWLWLGGSLQRLKPVQTETEVDVGPMVGFGKRGAPGWSLSFYAYGLTRSTPSYLVTLAVQL
jgi:hypothetical protein